MESMTPYRPTLLVVDDDSDTVGTMATFFEMRGMHALRATSSADALALARAIAVDAVIADLSMPRESGLVMARRLREELGMLDVPLLAVSGVLADRHRDAVLGAGFAAFYTKPVRPQLLAQKIVELVESARNVPAR
jgi:DNA-binding response OmpR family regulator